MSDNNGKNRHTNVAEIHLISNLDTGELQMRVTDDPRVALQILGKAVALLGQKMIEAENKKSSSGVVVAPASALRRLPDA